MENTIRYDMIEKFNVQNKAKYAFTHSAKATPT